MTPLDQEAFRVVLAYQAALAQLSGQIILEAIRLWQRLNPGRFDRSSDLWLSEVIALALQRHNEARDLGEAFYRLYRALLWERTVRASDGSDGDEVSLNELRDRFAELVDGLPAESAYVPGNDDVLIPIDNFEIETASQRRVREEQARSQAEVLLRVLGQERIRKRFEELNLDDLTASEADVLRNEILDSAEEQQASAVELVAENGARGLVHNAVNNDQASLGWVRVSSTGMPCGFCAMLISRGFRHLYNSQKSALGAVNHDRSKEEGNWVGDEYHRNCKCIAVPVFSLSQYNSSEMFALNRELSQMWQSGNGIEVRPGETFRQAWNRHFRQERERAQEAHDEAQEA